jgi:hypothetical protein
MRPLIAVLILTLTFFAPQLSHGRGGARSGGNRSSGFWSSADQPVTNSNKSVHVRSYTKKNGTTVQGYDRSAPGTGSGKSRSTQSASTSSSLADDAFGSPRVTAQQQVSHGVMGSNVAQSASSQIVSPSSSTTAQSTSSTTTNGTSSNNTAQFVNGFPFPAGTAWALGMDPETAARRQFGPLVTNARNLIRAGVYPQAVALLQRVIAGAPGTRIAGEAQRLLTTVPAQ